MKIDNWPAANVTMRAVAELTPYANNSRTHSPQQVDQIAASINEWGWTMPVLVDEKGMLIAGHGRIMAAQKLGIEEVPTMVAEGWTEAQKKAYVIADNKLALNAGWDDEALRIEMEALQELGFDRSLTGFDDTELSKLFDLGAGEQAGQDDVPELMDDCVSQQGDVWLLGEHRVMCGDSTSKQDIETLMQGKQADTVWTDPPYNVAIEGAAGTIKNDDMPDSEFATFLRQVYDRLYETLRAGGVIYVAHADTEGVNFRQQFVQSGLKLSQLLIWVKDTATLSRQDFNWQHEPILYGWKEGAGHYFCQDFTLTTVIDDEPSKDFSKMTKAELVEILQGLKTSIIRCDRPKRSAEHPTMKPVDLVERMIRWSSIVGDTVLDVFGGSGTTLIAAEKNNRVARLMELDPKYCDVIVKRWQDFTGREATLEASGDKFNDIFINGRTGDSANA